MDYKVVISLIEFLSLLLFSLGVCLIFSMRTLSVAARALYGGTFTLFNETLPQLGIEVRFIDAEDPENFVRAMDDNTRAFFCETVSNVRYAS